MAPPCTATPTDKLQQSWRKTVAKLLSRLFDESANFFISSTMLSFVVSTGERRQNMGGGVRVMVEGGGDGGGGVVTNLSLLLEW